MTVSTDTVIISLGPIHTRMKVSHCLSGVHKSFVVVEEWNKEFSLGLLTFRNQNKESGSSLRWPSSCQSLWKKHYYSVGSLYANIILFKCCQENSRLSCGRCYCPYWQNSSSLLMPPTHPVFGMSNARWHFRVSNLWVEETRLWLLRCRQKVWLVHAAAGNYIWCNLESTDIVQNKESEWSGNIDMSDQMLNRSTPSLCLAVH